MALIANNGTGKTSLLKIIAGSDVPLGGDPALTRELLGGAVPAQMWTDERVREFARDAKVLRD